MRFAQKAASPKKKKGNLKTIQFVDFYLLLITLIPRAAMI
jgi:hypothetical protein